jgi:hypothetical protein
MSTTDNAALLTGGSRGAPRTVAPTLIRAPRTGVCAGCPELLIYVRDFPGMTRDSDARHTKCVSSLETTGVSSCPERLVCVTG